MKHLFTIVIVLLMSASIYQNFRIIQPLKDQRDLAMQAAREAQAVAERSQDVARTAQKGWKMCLEERAHQ